MARRREPDEVATKGDQDIVVERLCGFNKNIGGREDAKTVFGRKGNFGYETGKL